MHVGIVGIRSGPIAGWRQSGIFVPFSPAHVAIGFPLHAGLEDVLDGAPVVQPVVFEGGGVVQLAGVGDEVRVEGEREGLGHPVTLFLGVHGRLGRSVGIVFMVVGPLVVVVDAAFELQVGDPAAVEEPDQFEVRGQEIVPLLGEFVGEGVGVRGGVHSTDIAAQAGFQPQLTAEGAGVVQGEAPASVGGVGGSELAGGAGPFGPYI